MNTPVSFEVAKLLKEKDYDGCYKGFWIETLEHEFDVPRDGITIFPKIAPRILENLPKEDYHIFHAFATTIAEVCMWLYEKHGIWIQAYPRRYDDLKLMWTYSLIVIEDGYTIDGIEFPNIDNPEDIPVWSTPQEAYLEAIKYTLDNLIK